MRLCLTILLSWLSITALPQYNIETYGTRQGLSGSEVNCVFQDSRGFIWIGTNFGLNFFDGTQFTHYYHSASDTNSLPHRIILSIAEDKQGRLWVGTQTGISCFDLLSKRFINYSPASKGNQKFNARFCHVFVSKSGMVWIGSGDGIYALDPAKDKMNFYPVQLSPANRYTNPFVTGFFEDDAGTILAGTSYGVYELRKEDKAFKLISGFDDRGEPYACTKLAMDKQGTLYCGTWNGKLLHKKQQDSFFSELPNVHESLAGRQVFDILFDNDSTTWLATNKGLVMTGLLKKEDRDASVRFLDMLSGDFTTRLLKDLNGKIWVGSNKGLVSVHDKLNFIQSFSFSSINNWTPLCLLPDNNGILVLNGLSLIRFDEKAKQFYLESQTTAYPHRIIRDKDQYWLTERPGLHLLDANLEKKKLFIYSDRSGLPFYFNHALRDREGRIWLGTIQRKGICIFDPSANTWQHVLNSDTAGINLAGQFIHKIIQDDEGDIWIAAKPLVRYRRALKKFETLSIDAPGHNHEEANSVRSLYADKKTIWIGTNSGLYSFDKNENKVREVVMPAMISPQLNAIEMDGKGNLWMIASNGLVFYDRVNNKFKLFNESHGFPANINGIAAMPDGRIMIGYEGHIAFIDPHLLNFKEAVTTPQWAQINIDNQPLPPGWKDRATRLKYDQSISFSFISPNYNNNFRHHYAYKLEGIDEEWNYIGSNNSQRFSNLPAGTYTFVVKAGNADGNWSDLARFTFLVAPPFWKTWWFIALAAVSISLLLYFVYRYRLGQALKMERLRTRIATDLHDDIGATLSSISMYSEAVKKQVKEKMPQLEPVLDKMGDNSRQMVSSMSDIVWAVNPENDVGGKLLERMESYARDTCAVTDTRLHFSSSDQLQLTTFPLEYRKNIYLIFKEALNNALKYGEATDIWISMDKKGYHFQLAVKDNGKGFDASGDFNGNGLKNLRARAREINAGLSIISFPQKGTTVSLDCKIS